MPTYNYHCEDCNFTFEESFKKASDQTSPCQKCQKPSERQVSTFSVGRSGTSRHSADMIIGAAAEQRWEGIKQRKDEKDKLRKESGNHAVGVAMERGGSGEIKYKYSSVSKERIEERKKLFSDAKTADVKISESINVPKKKS